MLHAGEKNYDKSIIVYCLTDGKVCGGSDPDRTVKQIKKDSDRYYPGGDYKLEMDLSAKTFTMELDGERYILDSNLGDFSFSPIVIMNSYAPEITLL